MRMRAPIIGLALGLLTLTACKESWTLGDADGDGVLVTSGDCDDDNAEVYPDATEVWYDGIDQNCDGNDADQDGDGFVPNSYVIDYPDWQTLFPRHAFYSAGDCDDEDPAVNPGAEEVCDDIDNDCDGNVDEDLKSSWYADSDNDSYGDNNLETEVEGCEAPAGYVAVAGDCQDDNPAVNPGTEEVCDGIDNDCNGSVDTDAVDAAIWYADNDGDSYGGDDTVSACEQPLGYVTDSTDCDDRDKSISPDADEVCDDIDNDCDGGIDEDAAVDADIWYADTDSDGYGDKDYTTSACEEPSGYTADAGDCDDDDSAINPAATEVCDGVDNDCDGSVDNNATDAAIWYRDSDSDGFGDDDDTTRECEQPSGYTVLPGDCDDSMSKVNPLALEICDGVDNDCDGGSDNNATDAATWYGDNDSDGYGDVTSLVITCTAPSGYVSDSTDCNDGDASINPGATDFNYNGVLESCSPEKEILWFADRSDGWLYECEMSGTTCTGIVSGLGEMIGVAYDGYQTIYVSQVSAGTISAIDLDTLSTTTFSTTFGTPAGLSWDFYNDQLLVVELATGKLWGFDPGADARVELATGFLVPVDAIATSATTFQVTDRSADEIVEVDTSAGTYSSLLSMSEPNCLVNGYVTSRSGGTVVDGSGSVVFTGLGSGNGRGLTFAPNGIDLVVGDYVNGQAYLFTPSSTAQTPSSSGVVTFTGLGQPFEGVSNSAP